MRKTGSANRTAALPVLLFAVIVHAEEPVAPKSEVSIEVSLSGTAHDFRSVGWNSSGEACLPCHTPHNALTDVTSGPLWNHETVTGKAYTLYDSDTMQADEAGTQAVSRSTLLCLGCHDGAVALDAFGGTTGSTYIPAAYRVNDLTVTHPVSITYNSSLADRDGGLHDPASPSGLGGSIQEDLLVEDKVECVSCHDVHGKAGIPYLLRMTNAGSQLCLTCHDK